MRFLVCNKHIVNWDVPSLQEYSGKLSKRPYTHYLLAKRLDASRNLWCLEKCLEMIQAPVGTVVEYFGGIGTDAALIQNMLRPSKHIAMDLDPECVNIYAKTFPMVTVAEADFYIVAGMKADVAILDIETYTIAKLNAREYDALRRVFRSTDIVILVDTAIGKFHLNYIAYEAMLNNTIHNRLHRRLNTINDYFQAVSEYYRDNYGWVILRACSHTRASYTVMVRSNKAPPVECISAPAEADDYLKEL